MGAREEILAALRRAGAREAALPELGELGLGLGVASDDVAAAFAAAVTAVGGTCVRAPERAAARQALGEIAAVRDARKVVSRVPELAPGNVDAAAIGDAHELDGIDVCVLRGELGVAENGAVWLDAAALPHAALFVIVEHLVLVVDARSVVADLHAAYARLAARPRAYGTFIAGPSKTADIEQSLVIGAHGPRSCTVLLVDVMD